MSTERALALDTATRVALRANLSPHAYEASARSRGRAAFAYETVLADGEATQLRYGEKDDDDTVGSDVWVVVPHTAAAVARVTAAGKALTTLAKRLVVGTPLSEFESSSSSSQTIVVAPLRGDDDDHAVVRAGVAYRLSVRFRLADDDPSSWGMLQRLAVAVAAPAEEVKKEDKKEEIKPPLRPEEVASATLARHVPKARAARRARAETARSRERVERLGRLLDYS